MLSINTNISSLITQSSMKQSTDKLNQAIERMTTGFKINHASDNAANYSISTNMTTKIGAYNIAEDNAAMGLDLISTAEGALNQIQDKLERLRALQEQASNGTYGTQSKDAINAEANALVDEINRLFSIAEYNGLKLFGSQTIESTPAVAMFSMARSTNTENYFIADPITYTEEEVEAMTTMTQAVSEGSLVSGGTYSISNVDELVALADYVNNGNDTTGMTFVLGADIDLSSISNWTPIGNMSAPFVGKFNGNGHLIKNLSITDTEGSFLGLFGVSFESIIENTKIENCRIIGYEAVGALVGLDYSSIIKNCYVTGTVTGGEAVGGLVGYAGISSSISECYTTVAVTGNSFVGGLVGDALDNSSISKCYVTGTVTGGNSVGGLVGGASNSSSISECYATGAVTGEMDVGGLVGGASNSSSISECYATGAVTGESNVGGLAGTGKGLITYSYAKGSVEGDLRVGGLIGYADYVTITNSYATGRVSGGIVSTGGLIGEVYDLDPFNLTDSYWDIKKSSIKTGVGTDSSYDNLGVSTSELNSLIVRGILPGNPIGEIDEYMSDTIVFQIGASSDWASQVDVSTKLELEGLEDLRMIGLDSTTDYLTQIDDMLALVSEKQTHFGAVSNRLESVLKEIIIQRDNLISSRSTIRDADIAEVSSHYIQQQILQQASATLLATANQSPSIALQLI